MHITNHWPLLPNGLSVTNKAYIDYPFRLECTRE